MPNYQYGCAFCNAEMEESRPVGERNNLPLCQRCGAPMGRVYVMPYVSATVNPTSRPETAAQLKGDKKWEADSEAYKRMRQNGVQPRGITNAAKVEKGAETVTELKMGKVMRPRDVRRGVDLSSEMLQKDLPL